MRAIFTLGVAVALVMTGCAVEPPAPSTFVGSGSLTVNLDRSGTFFASGLPQGSDLDTLKEGAKCVIADEYDDIGQGAQIVLKSSSGTILSTAKLGKPFVDIQAGLLPKCALEFEFGDVPLQVDDIYEVELLSGLHGSLIFNQAELEAGVVLLLG